MSNVIRISKDTIKDFVQRANEVVATKKPEQVEKEYPGYSRIGKDAVVIHLIEEEHGVTGVGLNLRGTHANIVAVQGVKGTYRTGQSQTMVIEDVRGETAARFGQSYAALIQIRAGNGDEYLRQNAQQLLSRTTQSSRALGEHAGKYDRHKTRG